MKQSSLATRTFNWIRGGRVSTGVILLYHRIAEEGADPWGLGVAPDHFEEHLRVLRQFGTPMGLQEFLRKRTESGTHERAIVVTFDGGYATTLTHAAPRLARHQIPATVFVTAGMMGHQREFWWDELERLLLLPGTLPPELALTIGGKVHRWTLGRAARYSERDYQMHLAWRAWDATCPTERQSLYRAIHEQLFPLDEESRQATLDDLAAWAGGVPRTGRDSHRLLSQETLSRLADEGGIQVGGHSLTYASLGRLRPRQQWQEIHEGKALLDRTLSEPVTSFAIPFGRSTDYSRETLALVRAAGFTSACTASGTTVEVWADPFELPRFTVRAKGGESFSAWMHDITRS